jgi:hypothetical protein
MGTSVVSTNDYMHNRSDGVWKDWQDAGPTEVDKHFIVQEREVSYRFTLHEHPFVTRLMQRLLAQDTAALLAADTEYEPDNAARPDSMEIELDDSVELTIPGGARVDLRQQVTATSGGATFELPATLSIVLGSTPQTKARAHAQSPALARLRALVLGGLKVTQTPGSSFTLPAGSRGLVIGNALIRLTTPAPVVLPGGAEAELPTGTELILAEGTELPFPDAAGVVLVRSKPQPTFFADALIVYAPSKLVQKPYPVKDLDFSTRGAYSVYNWELFFHVPLMVAMHLSKNGRYAEAQRWFHYVFDPTDNSDGPTPERFWKVQPFQETDVKKVEDILVNLATGADPDLRDETIQNINAWKNAPFRPHVIARYRQQAYMYRTVLAYLDNLIDWGDSLFRQDTGEAIDEALMVYVLAANILGPRPQAIPAKGSIRPRTYNSLRNDLKHFGAVAAEMEADPPFDLAPVPAADTGDGSALATLRGLGRALYFGVPRNDKLLGYWDTVANRLFKIRNSLNLQGAFRQLALFESPIDPALLARAAALGLDVATIVNGVNQPLPLVRFQLLSQKASEIVQEVKSLGNALLAAMEKEDGETLTLLRSKHERAVLGMVEQVKYGQLQEAIKAREGLLESLALAVQRYTYYELQLGRSLEDIQKATPNIDALDKTSFEQMKLATKEPALDLRDVEVNVVTDLNSSAVGKLISSYEAAESALLDLTEAGNVAAGLITLLSAKAEFVPKVEANVQPLGTGSTAKMPDAARVTSKTADWIRLGAEATRVAAQQAARMGNFDRRAQDWAFQSNLAAGEVNQIFKQLRAAQIREAVAEQDLATHRLQMKQAEEIERFLNEEGTQKNGKVTNKALYTFMKRDVKGLYGQCFQLAFDVAKKAERALQHELGDPSLSYLQFGYLAGKEGLLAGEKLYLDVKRMELAYLDLNRREYELTKHVSLLQMDPLALVELRATGRCSFRLPEELFDMDGPGHYFRRIKNVAITIPCVAGPFASVNCTLTLQKSSIRTTSSTEDDYTRAPGDDDRFSDFLGSLQSIVTSSGQNDSGLFETNLRDERYLPFENSGVISEWQLRLPADPSKDEPAQFNYDTISDVILHIRYTAREGGETLRQSAVKNLQTRIGDAEVVGSPRLFSLRHEFPVAWAAFKAAAPDANGFRPLKIKLTPEHYPFWSKTKQGETRKVRAELIARAAGEIGKIKVAKPDGTNADALQALFGNLKRTELKDALKPPLTGEWQAGLSNDTVEDVWLLVHWGSVQ